MVFRPLTQLRPDRRPSLFARDRPPRDPALLPVLCLRLSRGQTGRSLAQSRRELHLGLPAPGTIWWAADVIVGEIAHAHLWRELGTLVRGIGREAQVLDQAVELPPLVAILQQAEQIRWVDRDHRTTVIVELSYFFSYSFLRFVHEV